MEREDQTNKEQSAFGGGQSRIATQLITTDPQHAQRTRMVEVSLPAAVRRALRDQRKTPLDDEPRALFDQIAKEARHFYQRLHRLDRYVLWVLLVTFLATFFPWFLDRGAGLRAGVEGVGALSCGVTALALAAIYGRTVRRRLSGVLIVAQLLLITAAGGPVLYYLVVGSRDLVFGAWVTLAGAAAAALLTLARLTRLSH